MIKSKRWTAVMFQVRGPLSWKTHETMTTPAGVCCPTGVAMPPTGVALVASHIHHNHWYGGYNYAQYTFPPWIPPWKKQSIIYRWSPARMRRATNPKPPNFCLQVAIPPTGVAMPPTGVAMPPAKIGQQKLQWKSASLGAGLLELQYQLASVSNKKTDPTFEGNRILNPLSL